MTETAGIGGNSRVQCLSYFPVNIHQLPDYIIYDLTGRRRFGTDQIQLAIAGITAMMIYNDIRLLNIFCIATAHIRSGNINSNQRAPGLAGVLLTAHQMGIIGRNGIRAKKLYRLTHLLERPAQGCSRAHRIPIGSVMHKNGKLLCASQCGANFSYRIHLSSSLEAMSARI